LKRKSALNQPRFKEINRKLRLGLPNYYQMKKKSKEGIGRERKRETGSRANEVARPAHTHTFQIFTALLDLVKGVKKRCKEIL
jgi:hypothetical protein